MYDGVVVVRRKPGRPSPGRSSRHGQAEAERQERFTSGRRPGAEVWP